MTNLITVTMVILLLFAVSAMIIAGILAKNKNDNWRAPAYY